VVVVVVVVMEGMRRRLLTLMVIHRTEMEVLEVLVKEANTLSYLILQLYQARILYKYWLVRVEAQVATEVEILYHQKILLNFRTALRAAPVVVVVMVIVHL
jgi:hypothetical protein